MNFEKRKLHWLRGLLIYFRCAVFAFAGGCMAIPFLLLLIPAEFFWPHAFSNGADDEIMNWVVIGCVIVFAPYFASKAAEEEGADFVPSLGSLRPKRDRP